MAIPAVAKDLLQIHLPAKIQKIIDFDTLNLEKESFIEEGLKSSIGDVLFSVKSGDKDVYIYILIEHQSKPDYWMAFRLWKYQLNICEQYRKKHSKSKKLPLIYPMVFYNGKRKYNAERNIWNLFEDPSLAQEFWSGNHQVVNVSEMQDDELKDHPYAGFMQLSMKYIRDPYLLEMWKQMVHHLPRINVEIGRDYIRMMAYYALTGMPEDDIIELKELVTKNLVEEDGEEIMRTAAQALREEGHWAGRQEGVEQGVLMGIEQGIEQGIELVAINMINNGMSLVDVSKNTGLTIKVLMMLCQKKRR